ncbi:hypothetical protein CKO15_05990 [Halorhodospira abdelmalekii]|uniref:flagellar protein FlaG n=1 Tax=Halorhodospira abdelmalekii TaxID=421629 RepID=UPI0019069B58|nr:flagellar protein FlaG [Halorhodospira abdelmalekii]MBK1734846.1 hypothetical protein [Halorhodospira abdelmalekii]
MSEIHGYSAVTAAGYGWGRTVNQSPDEVSGNQRAGRGVEAAGGAGESEQKEGKGAQHLLMAPSGDLSPLDVYRAEDPEALAQAVERFENFIRKMGRDLEISVDDRTGKTVVTVYVRGTEDVVRQIPPEEMLAVAAHLKEVQGMLFDEHA